ncbi:hypothetical protein ACH5RR_021960 [Cinchona calisaya]|uniref:Uncharacterized protein n=1 Tax=Cinchona calisaya TaxID=153742 RepID=A0ABD2ZBI1_9GENT
MNVKFMFSRITCTNFRLMRTFSSRCFISFCFLSIHALFFPGWPKINIFDPLDTTVYEVDECNFDITPDPDFTQSESGEDECDIENEFGRHEEKPKPNLEETETVNIGTDMDVIEVKISIHLTRGQKKEMIEFLILYQDVFTWS